AEAEGHQDLVLGRAAVEIADDDALHHHAEQHHEQRAGGERRDERAGVLVGDEPGVSAEHEHRAVREVEHAERAVDDGEPRADQREQRAQHEPVEHLRDEIDPVDHDEPRGRASVMSAKNEVFAPPLTLQGGRGVGGMPAFTQMYSPRWQPNASGFCISGPPGTTSVTSQKSSLFFMSFGDLPLTMTTGRTSW